MSQACDQCGLGFNQRLKFARLLRGRHQYQVSREVGVGDPTWSTWERGTRSPTIKRLTQIAETLDVDPAWLIFGKGEIPT